MLADYMHAAYGPGGPVHALKTIFRHHMMMKTLVLTICTAESVQQCKMSRNKTRP